MIDQSLENVLTTHAERMRLIGEHDRRQTTRLGMLHTLLIYRNATSNMKIDEAANKLAEDIIMEASNVPDLAAVSGASGAGATNGTADEVVPAATAG